MAVLICAGWRLVTRHDLIDKGTTVALLSIEALGSSILRGSFQSAQEFLGLFLTKNGGNRLRYSAWRLVTRPT
jgi:hypothetical protein